MNRNDKSLGSSIFDENMVAALAPRQNPTFSLNSSGKRFA
jgi:hypothetical protein